MTLYVRLSKTIVQLGQYPQTITAHRNTEHLSIGDLHANPIKLLFTLIKEGVILFAKEDYQLYFQCYSELLALYNLPQNPSKETKSKEIELIQKMLRLTHQIKTNPENKSKVTLIGDILADRGLNDALMIYMLYALESLHVNFKILSSNHDAWFLSFYESKQKISTGNIGYQYHSLIKFKEAKYALGFNDDWMNRFFSECYLKNLQLLNYDVSASKIVIYSHAPIQFKTIKGIAAELRMADQYSHMTPKLLAATIDKINQTFIRRIQSGEFFFSSMERSFPNIFKTHWGRVSEIHGISVGSIEPDFSLDYGVEFVYGHDGQNYLYRGNFCHPIDTQLGKNAFAPNGVISPINEGTYISCVVSQYRPRLNSNLCVTTDKLLINDEALIELAQQVAIAKLTSLSAIFEFVYSTISTDLHTLGTPVSASTDTLLSLFSSLYHLGWQSRVNNQLHLFNQQDLMNILTYPYPNLNGRSITQFVEMVSKDNRFSVDLTNIELILQTVALSAYKAGYEPQPQKVMLHSYPTLMPAQIAFIPGYSINRP